jgi:hypothetical protein
VTSRAAQRLEDVVVASAVALTVLLVFLGAFAALARGPGLRGDGSPAVTVAPGILATGDPWWNGHGRAGEPDGWETEPVFFVVADDDAAAVDAVLAAAGRISAIDEKGRELADWELWNLVGWTPGWVGVSRVGVGFEIAADTDGSLPRAQGEAMVRVLVEELDARHLTASVTLPPENAPAGEELTAPVPEEPERPTAFYVLRPVPATTTTGVPYEEQEWLRDDGTWTRDRSLARAFVESPDRLVAELDVAASAAQDPSPLAVTMPLDPTVVPWPLPPDDIREPA